MNPQTSTRRRAIVAIALGALTFGATLPAAAAPPDHAVEAREAGQATGAQARAAGLARAAEANAHTVPAPEDESDGGGVTIQGIAWK